MDQDFESPIVEQEVFPSEGAQASGSSFEAPELDISKGKSKQPESEFVDVALLQNMENSFKDSKTSKLQENLCGLTSLFFDPKQHLHQKFGNNFQPLSAEGEQISASSSSPVNPTSQPPSERLVRHATDANLDTFLSSSPASAQERRLGRNIQTKMLVTKHSNQNAPENLDRIEKDKQIEYYEKKDDFLSWIKLDIFELIHAAFHNPTNDPMAWSFKSFLEDKAKNNFEGMKTASSFTKNAKDIIDHHTRKTMVNVMWSPTKQAKRIPLRKRLPEGTLDSMQFWGYDDAIAPVVIKLKKNQYRIVDPKDLLRLCECDIRNLSKFQIDIENELFEAAAKAFTGMVATIIE
ncbi:unnamed protein product [Lactuca saligna]|uniref:Uncharacterized protein n=1 Tax=Lactuca saligna TaxID=75948 RepID=A0AA35ZNK9_LACSI|nr:unnamed protein product [Lactuca saligna]